MKEQQQQRVPSTLLALAILAAFSIFVFIAQSTVTALYKTPLSARLVVRTNSLSSVRVAGKAALETGAVNVNTNAHHRTPARPTHRRRKHTQSTFPPPSALRLTQTQELAAVTSFLASLSSNVLPPSVDPAQPIDPQLVLDFQLDPARMGEARVADELRAMVRDVWARNPVLLYSKLHSPVSRDLKAILANLYLLPAPTIIDVDVRDDAEILTPMIKRLAGFPELPLLIIGGTPVGSLDEVKALEKSGELAKMITEAGAQVNGAKKKKKRR